MTDIKPHQAVCIKEYKNKGIGFEVNLLEIVTIEKESHGDALIWVKNKYGWVWYFIKNKKLDIFFRTTPVLEAFDDYFKEIK